MAKGPRFRIQYTKRRAQGDEGSDGEGGSTILDHVRGAVFRAAAGKVWWYRAPLLLPLAWILYRHLGDADYSSIFGGLNLAIHEGGHLLFMWSGNQFLTVAGGTVLQCLCPVFVGIMFYRQRDFFAITVALFWLGTNFAHIAPYAADARAQLLPLVSPFPGAPMHDWHYLLRTLGLLQRDQLVGAAFRGAGLVTMVAGLAAGGCVLRIIAERVAAPESADKEHEPEDPRGPDSRPSERSLTTSRCPPRPSVVSSRIILNDTM